MRLKHIRQNLSLNQSQTISLSPSAVDIQDFALGCGRTAERLFKEYNGNIKKIKEELKEKKIDGNMKEEIMWAVRWLKG